MRKILGVAAAFVVLGVLLVLQECIVHARITGTQPTSADIWCVGPDGAEVCVVDGGGLNPTTDNDAALGTSSLRWSDVQSLDATFGDDVTITDALTVNGPSLLGDGPADEVGINEATPDASLEVSAGDNTFVLLVSSQNGSTALLSVASADGAIVQEGGVILNEGGAAVDLRVEGDNTANLLIVRSEERRVGKEGRSRWSPYH